MKELILSFLHALRDQEQFNEEAEEWQFDDGSACGICTHSAIHVARAFAGVVLGYLAENNPRAELGDAYSQGHDFAIVEDRWLVDYWTWRTTGLLDHPVLDLGEAADLAVGTRLYGKSSYWDLVLDCRPHLGAQPEGVASALHLASGGTSACVSARIAPPTSPSASPVSPPAWR
jgi:hypothetical protein